MLWIENDFKSSDNSLWGPNSENYLIMIERQPLFLKMSKNSENRTGTNTIKSLSEMRQSAKNKNLSLPSRWEKLKPKPQLGKSVPLKIGQGFVAPLLPLNLLICTEDPYICSRLADHENLSSTVRWDVIILQILKSKTLTWESVNNKFSWKPKKI